MAYASINQTSIEAAVAADTRISPELTHRQMTEAWKAAAVGFQNFVDRSCMAPGTAMTPLAAMVMECCVSGAEPETEFLSPDTGFDFQPVTNFFYC